jgi:biotin carboxyl carrier protein
MKVRVQIDNLSYDVEIADLSERPITAVIEGQSFTVWPDEGDGAPAASPPVATGQSAAGSAPAAYSPVVLTPAGEDVVTAPLPGVVVAVSVMPGDVVTAEQQLCVIEAMKMKNPIRAAHPGVVTAVHVIEGQQVKHGQPLVQFR